MTALVSLGAPACAISGRLEAASPQAALLDPEPRSEEPPPEPSGDEQPANPDDGEVSSTGALPAPAPAESALVWPNRRALGTGIALSAAGMITVAMGGFMVGWGGSACHSADVSCVESGVIPTLGVLWIAAGVVPLVMGVSLWVPRERADETGDAGKPGKSAPATQSSRLRPSVHVGPAAAALRWKF